MPEISESDASGDAERIERIIARVLKTVLLYSIGVAGVMICLSQEFGAVLFNDLDSAKYILFVAPLVPVMYLDTSVDSILKGLGYQFYCMVINIVDALLSVIFVWVLLPRYGIMGYISTVYFTELVNAALSITKLLCVTKFRFKLLDWLIKPLLAIVVSTATIRFILGRIGTFAENKLDIALHVICTAMIYFALLLVVRAISLRRIKKSVVNFIKA